jgi:hypothetical protein
MWDLWWTKWYWGRFSSSTWFSLPILIPLTAPHSLSSSIIRGWYNNRSNSGLRTKWTQSHPIPSNYEKEKEKEVNVILVIQNAPSAFRL